MQQSTKKNTAVCAICILATVALILKLNQFSNNLLFKEQYNIARTDQTLHSDEGN